MSAFLRWLFGTDTDHRSDDGVLRIVAVGEATPTLASDAGIAWAVGTSDDLKLELKQKRYTEMSLT